MFLNRWVHAVYDLLFHLPAQFGILSSSLHVLSCLCGFPVLRLVMNHVSLHSP